MKKSTFSSPQSRRIIIEISSEYISFFHEDNVQRQQEWLQEQIENDVEVSEDDKKVDEFYYIPINEWVSDRTTRQDRGDNWHYHMIEKSWFTREMYLFIDKNV
jgi:hypothetical protein